MWSPKGWTLRGVFSLAALVPRHPFFGVLEPSGLLLRFRAAAPTVGRAHAPQTPAAEERPEG
eukprot:1023670-Prorocentrum_minimum.AAC.1